MEKLEEGINIENNTEKIDFEALHQQVESIKREEMIKKNNGGKYDPHFDFVEPDKLIEEDLIIFDKFLKKILTKKEFSYYKPLGGLGDARLEFKAWLGNKVLCDGNLEWFDSDMLEDL
jgi:hypothetical protein